MLGLMRRHVNWGLKVILTVTIITFVFFFGYNKLSETNREGTAISVGKQDITHSQYQFFYQNQYERLRTSFKGEELPPILIQNLQGTVKEQLATASLIEQFAKKLGFTVTDEELASTIVSQKDFDPVSYKSFINDFYLRYGFAYEDMVRQELLIQKFQVWAQNTEKLYNPAASDKKTAKKDAAANPGPAYLPELRLIDFWFRDFAEKTPVKSYIKAENP